MDAIKGVAEVIAAAQAAGKRAREGAARGLGLAAQNVLNVSNTRVPHEEGDLERDGGWSVDDAQLKAAVSYGRRADVKDYAVVQHEDMSLNHDAGRSAKFLESAITGERATSAEIIAAQTRSSFQGGS